ncbi:MAG: valine--tRNA ligase [Provencibacterium sp.]|jgi:valyl-tRNA synthetase|nr:valine--tRNA ligase [Provencibacterium sp.]
MEELEKRYEGLQAEKRLQAAWEQEQLYTYRPDPEKPVYSIDTPPPTVSGSLHIGHIFSYTQAEMIARYRRMRGYNVFYPFGFDDNGLPSERLVEKETGIRAMEAPRSQFCAQCVETTQKYEEEFKALWKALGFSCDWDLQYTTVSEKAQRVSQASFIELAKAGHAYMKESPVLWCTECRTSIAQAELESKDLDTQFCYLPFVSEGETVEVATTRPELLYGVVAVFVHPKDPRYQKLIGKTVAVPLYGFEAPVLADEKVGMDKGTGAVMCATFGDSTDLEWVESYGLPDKKIILPDGHIAPEVPWIGGLSVRAARKEIIRLLEERGLLLKTERLTHAVSVHERCGTEVEILPSRQWYIDVLSQKEALLEAGERIHWHPAAMKSRYRNWVVNLKWDWCISRQRYFGVPFPVWYCEQCGKPHFAEPSQLPVNPMEIPYTGVCSCGSRAFIPELAVLDTWATSSMTPFINQETAWEKGEKKRFLPMGMRTQAHEIIRTWAFYTIVKSLYHAGEIPWKDIMICGFVLAKPGEKISKSKGNARLTPQALLETYPADMIRYWTASARLGTDTFFEPKEMEDASKRFMTKLWNASRFCLLHLADFDPDRRPELLPVDRWIIERTRQTVLQAARYLDAYEIGLARHTIDGLFWNDLCDDYIEIVKERLYQPEIHGEEGRAAAQYAIHFCLLNVLKLYAPFVPHITEEIYRKGFRDWEGASSIHLLLWEEVTEVDADILDFGREFKAALAKMRKFKTERGLSMREPLDCLEIQTSRSHKGLFERNKKDLEACTHAKEIRYQISDESISE